MWMTKRFLLQALLALGAVQAHVMPGGQLNFFALRTQAATKDNLRASLSTMGLARQKKQQFHLELRGGASPSSSTASSQIKDSQSPTLLGVPPSFLSRVLLLAASPQVARLLFAYSQGGFIELTTSPNALPEPWQAALASVWAISLFAVAVPGRYDGLRDTDPVPLTERTANLFVPSGWAFAIWGPIFLGEVRGDFFCFLLFGCVWESSVRDFRRVALLVRGVLPLVWSLLLISRSSHFILLLFNIDFDDVAAHGRGAEGQ